MCDRHAGWLLGAEMVLAPNEHLRIATDLRLHGPPGMGRLRNDLADSGERNLKESETSRARRDLRVTTPLRTAWDLGRVRWTDQAIAGIDAMLALGQSTKSEFLEWRRALQGACDGSRSCALSAPFGGRRAHSHRASPILRLRWIEAHLPTPHPQLEVLPRATTLIAILDIANPDLRYAAEYDGAEWHTLRRSERTRSPQRRNAVRDEEWVVDAFVCREPLRPSARMRTSRLRAGAVEARQRFGSRVA